MEVVEPQGHLVLQDLAEQVVHQEHQVLQEQAEVVEPQGHLVLQDLAERVVLQVHQVLQEHQEQMLIITFFHFFNNAFT